MSSRPHRGRVVATFPRKIPFSSPFTANITSPLRPTSNDTTVSWLANFSGRALAQYPYLLVRSGHAYRGRVVRRSGSWMVKPNLSTPLQLVDTCTNLRCTLSPSTTGRLLKQMPLQKVSMRLAVRWSDVSSMFGLWVEWKKRGHPLFLWHIWGSDKPDRLLFNGWNRSIHNF